MKKFVFLTVIGLILLFPFSLESKQLYIKMSFGLFSGGIVNDSWHFNPEYYDCTFTQAKRPSPGMDLSLEFVFQLHPNVGLSLGTGYISRSLSGEKGHFTILDPSERVDGFSVSPKFSSEMTPFYLTAIFSIPIRASFQVNFLGGAGYYLGNIKGAHFGSSYSEYSHPAAVANRLIWKFESRTHAAGLHFGAGIDMAVMDEMALFFEAFYRKTTFKKIKTSVRKMTQSGVPLALAIIIGETGENLGEDTTFFYMQKIREVEEQKNIDYQISRFDYSGLSLRTGLKFRF